eukprot:5394443-Pleurochrysis_carterae.AAC.2
MSDAVCAAPAPPTPHAGAAHLNADCLHASKPLRPRGACAAYTREQAKQAQPTSGTCHKESGYWSPPAADSLDGLRVERGALGALRILWNYTSPDGIPIACQTRDAASCDSDAHARERAHARAGSRAHPRCSRSCSSRETPARCPRATDRHMCLRCSACNGKHTQIVLQC